MKDLIEREAVQAIIDELWQDTYKELSLESIACQTVLEIAEQRLRALTAATDERRCETCRLWHELRRDPDIGDCWWDIHCAGCGTFGAERNRNHFCASWQPRDRHEP